MPRRFRFRGAAAKFARRAQLCACCALLACAGVDAATLADKAKESGCVNKPIAIAGDTYRCATASGAFSYFNVPGGDGERRSTKTSTPASFPRVDPATQKGRDDLRRKVLADELAAEEKLLVESRTAFADGAPAPLPEERADAEKYRARIARLRQTVAVHEKNIEALKKELGTIK
jgi:hypothetical protein